MPGNDAAPMHGMPGIWALAQLYRDRADAENNFDELKINGDGAVSLRKTSHAVGSSRARKP